MICASVQLVTFPGRLPSVTVPLPCAAPKPEPVMVTDPPGLAEVGLMVENSGVFTAKATALLSTPLFRIRALPDAAPAATTATTCVSLQLCTTRSRFPARPGCCLASIRILNL